MFNSDFTKIEKTLSKEVKKQLMEDAEVMAEEHFLSNVGEEDYPKDVWETLADVDEDYAVNAEGVEVWEPFENYSASALLEEMENFKDYQYQAMVSAIGVYQESLRKEKKNSNSASL